MKTNTPYSRKKKKRALNKKNQFPLPNVRVRSCCSCDTCCLNHQLVPQQCSCHRFGIVMHWAFLSSCIRHLKFTLSSFTDNCFQTQMRLQYLFSVLQFTTIWLSRLVFATELEVKAKIKITYQKENLHRNDKQNL